MKLLGRLKLWQKLAVLVAGLLIPTVLAGAFYFRTVGEDVRLARAELDGARYLEPLGVVLAEVFNHRSSAHAMLNGDTSQKDALAASEVRMETLRDTALGRPGRFASGQMHEQADQGHRPHDHRARGQIEHGGQDEPDDVTGQRERVA